MQINGAIVKENGLKFTILIVKQHVIRNEEESDDFIKWAGGYFPKPVVLMAQDSDGIPTYKGRDDIIQYLSTLKLSEISWKRYTLS